MYRGLHRYNWHYSARVTLKASPKPLRNTLRNLFPALSVQRKLTLLYNQIFLRTLALYVQRRSTPVSSILYTCLRHMVSKIIFVSTLTLHTVNAACSSFIPESACRIISFTGPRSASIFTVLLDQLLVVNKQICSTNS